MSWLTKFKSDSKTNSATGFGLNLLTPILVFVISLQLVLLLSALMGSSPKGDFLSQGAPEAGQSLEINGVPEHFLESSRDEFKASDITFTGTAAAQKAQEHAWQLVKDYGWDLGEFNCLVKLWNKESHWNYKAENSSSGAYGIPQAVPGKKMASAGSDWKTNYKTQVKWGLNYIDKRYDSPCGAWNHSQEKNWY